jgi:hypothetical protein
MEQKNAIQLLDWPRKPDLHIPNSMLLSESILLLKVGHFWRLSQ